MNKKILITAATFGMLSILFGAFGAHGLKTILNVQQLDAFKTGTDYQMYHALFLFSVVALSSFVSLQFLKRIFLLTSFGVVLFSGSIYFLTLNSALSWFQLPKFIPLLTPIGGLLLLSAWLTFIVGLIRK